jgi:hypothetical protein
VLALINAAAGGNLSLRTILDLFSVVSGIATFTTTTLTLELNDTVPVVTSITQMHVQMYRDDGSLSVASQYNQLDSQLTLPAGSKFRARFNLRQSTGSTANRYALQYRVNGGPWGVVKSATQVAMSLSPHFADLAATPQRISVGSFAAGVGIETVVDTGLIAINATSVVKDTELEWSLLLDNSLRSFDFIQLRVVAVQSAWSGGGTTTYVLSAYSVYGAVMVLGGLNVTVERATIYEASQWVPEVTPGTALAAIKRLLCVEVDPDNTFNSRVFRRMGVKFPVKIDTGKEYSTSRLMGNVAYNDICYLLDSLLTTVAPTTPTNNAKWNVTVGAASAGTFVLTFNGQSTAAIAFGATAAAVAAALGAISTVGTGNVSVTGPAPNWAVQFIGALSTTTLALTGAGTGLTGGAFGSVLDTAATLTRRRTYFPLFDQPDTFRTYTVEKGIPAQANFAQQLAYFCLTNMDMKFTKDEASFTGGAISQKAVDPFTMTTASVVDVEPIPIDPASVSVFAGDALVGASGIQRLTRCFEFNLAVNGRSGPVITLDDTVSSYSAVIEKQTDWGGTLVMEHDSAGQNILAKLRGGTTQFLVFEAKGGLIETGFPYRFKITLPCKFTTGPVADVDGVYCRQWAVSPMYDTAFGGGLKIEVDNKMATL